MHYELRVHHVLTGLYEHIMNWEKKAPGNSEKHSIKMNKGLAKVASSDTNTVAVIYGITGLDLICASCPFYKSYCTKEPEPIDADAESVAEAPIEVGRTYTVGELRRIFQELSEVQ